MDDSLTIFEQFSKGRKSKEKSQSSFNSVIYTRVSTKEQADNNQSLETQLKACIQLAAQNKFAVLGKFGGTYESAKTDERKEFNKMLDFVRKSKEKISYIIVYSVDRFSRSGANAIYIANELKKEGISVLSVTQPTDTKTASGTFQQNIQFIFSQYDNDLRKEKCIAGTKERLLKGLWTTNYPMGYESNGKGKSSDSPLVINETGKLLRKAFHWKAEQRLTSKEIISKLAGYGLKLSPQQMSKVFRNPFYCGLIVHTSLDGQVVEGKHEKLVSRELFLKANDVLSENSQHYKHQNENINLPLKRFVKCQECGTSFTGYLVKKKDLYYYKCNKIGCKCNRSAKALHRLFSNMLESYSIDTDLIPELEDSMISVFNELNRSAIENKSMLEKQLEEVESKIELLQEKFILGDIDKGLYEKFSLKYKAEKDTIIKETQKSGFDLSNLKNHIKAIVKLATNVHKMWELGSYSLKERVQYLLFPDGIYYDAKNDVYRTERVNEVFGLLRYLSDSYVEKNKRQETVKFDLSLLVVGTGIAPVFRP